MRFLIVTPAKPGTTKGNRITAVRWAGILRSLGHRVTIDQAYTAGSFDALIALHARKSANSVSRFQARHPGRPVVVALTGTDLHQDWGKHAVVEQTLNRADAIVSLEPHGILKLNTELQKKTHPIYQSSTPVSNPPRKLKRCFEVIVLGHLRPIKDPFRAAMAAKLLPAQSRVRVIHFGDALTASMKRRAERETATNPRYRWLGHVSHGKAKRRLARSRLLILSSKDEGGSSTIAEAIVNNVPVLVSRNAAAIGMLGADYPGIFAYRDTESLAQMIHQSETDPKFYRDLKKCAAKLKPQFSPAREKTAWRNLIKNLL